MAIPGAPAALKGYRLQHLYVLHRLLNAGASGGMAFQLEGTEDLDVYDVETGILVEAAQVKAYEDKPITASSLFSKEDSFFRRSELRLQAHPSSVQKVISFGPFGETLAGAVSGSSSELTTTLAYLESRGFTAGVGRQILAAMRLEVVSEELLEQETLAALGETLAGIDPQTTFLFLSGWLIRAGEQSVRMTSDDLHARLQAIGSLATESAFEHLNWGSSIRPVPDSGDLTPKSIESLRDEFFRGSYTSLAHIMALVDVPRQPLLEQIHELFSRSNSVAIHGASGQGKTALAYRYLLDQAEGAWRFEIRHIEDGAHALQISRVLTRHARAIGVRLFVYIDVPPLSLAWRLIVRELSSSNNIRVLVTLREEDWSRAQVDGFQFEIAEFSLQFTEVDARNIFRVLADVSRPSKWIDFMEVWSHFGGQGPLMEFTHLITQNEALRSRLTSQTKALREQVRLGTLSKLELELLCRVAVASAFGARLDLKKLTADLMLPDPGQTVAFFEREYLLRTDVHGRHLSGLHPIRSQILVDLLIDEGAGRDWTEVAASCLASMEDSDIEGFLISSLLTMGYRGIRLFQGLDDFTPQSWRASAGIVRAMIVRGVQEYVSKHADVLAQAQLSFGAGWWLVVPFDMTGIRKSISWPLSMFSDQKSLNALASRFDDCKIVTTHAARWLRGGRFGGISVDVEGLEGFGEIAFWMGVLNVPCTWSASLPPEVCEKFANEAPLESLLDFALCCSFGTPPPGFEQIWAIAMARYRKEYLVLSVEMSDDIVRAHYIYSRETNLRRGGEYNAVVMERVNALRCLAPSCEKFGAHGYGHALVSPGQHDPARKKGIERMTLPPRRLVQVNSVFMALVESVLPKNSWTLYAECALEIRRDVVAGLNMLCEFLVAYFRSPRAIDPQQAGLEHAQWQSILQKLNSDPEMPRPLIPLGTPPSLDLLGSLRSTVPEWRRHGAAVKEYFSSLRNFFSQAFAAIFACIYTGRGEPAPSEGELRRWLGEKKIADHRHISAWNLLASLRRLPAAQAGIAAVLDKIPAVDVPGSLIAEEEDVLTRVVELWFLMIYSSRLRTRDPFSVAARKFKLPIERIRADLATAFAAMCRDGLSASLLEGTVIADGKRSWLAVIDGPSVEAVESACLVVISIFREVIARRMAGDVLVLLDDSAYYTVVVPTVGGRAIFEGGWKLLTTSMPPAGESSPPQCVPFGDDLWSQIDLPVWGPDVTEPMLQLLKDAKMLVELVSHLRWILGAPADEIGHSLREQYWCHSWQELDLMLEGVRCSLAFARQSFQAVGLDEKVLDELTSLLALPDKVGASSFPDSATLDGWETSLSHGVRICTAIWAAWCDLGVEFNNINVTC